MDKARNPLVSRGADKILKPTKKGLEYLDRITTDPTGDVYAFTSEADPLMIAGAMARLSRRSDDMRLTILDEFAEAPPEKLAGLFHRVITAFGDDSVQQLMPIALTVENASNLLTKMLEWGRLGAYLEQSTRYIFFDTPRSDGTFRYHTPSELSGDLRDDYNSSLDQIFGLYSEIVRGMTDYVRMRHSEPEDRSERAAWLGATRAQACDAARPTLPAATTSTVGIIASAQAIDNMIMNMASLGLTEYQETALRILDQSRKVAAPFFERTDLPERGGAAIQYRRDNRLRMRKLTAELIGEPKGMIQPRSEQVVLVDYWPKNELDVVSRLLFDSTTLSHAEIEQRVRVLGTEQKVALLEVYVGERLNRRHRPGRAMEFPHYEWELLLDYGIFRDLQRHRMLDLPEWQPLTPFYGYDVPKLVVEAGFEDQFILCFKISLGLYLRMVDAGHSEEAQYATLMGHRMRFRFMENARQAFHLHEIRTTPQGHPGYRRVVREMHRQLCEVHPHIGKAMCFVNQDEDPELTRLAGERATQAKLRLLGAQE